MTAAPGLPGLTHRAECRSCSWAVDAATWQELERESARHARAGHVVVSLTLPGKAS